MTEVEILTEMVGIYKKYFDIVLQMGTISMSPKDELRLKELESQLEALKTS